jgi:cell division protein DivIC
MDRRRRRRRNSNKLGFISIGVVLSFVLAGLFIQGNKLEKKNQQYQKKEDELTAKIEEESQRTEDIEELSKYMQTKEFVEKTAKDKLGLVYEDEIIFKSEQ